MARMATIADKLALEATPWAGRAPARTLYRFLTATAERFPDRPAVSFQLLSGPRDRALTLSWRGFHARVTQAANLLRSLGVGERDVVAFVLPNATETAEVLLGGAIAGIVNPINPLLDAEQIAAILRESGARVVVTLKAFPRTDVAQRTARAVALAPDVEVVLEVDLLRHLAAPKSWIVPLLRPANPVPHRARVLSWAAEMRRQPGDRLAFADAQGDRIAALFHTGGTTGMPKVAQHSWEGMIYNGWCGHELLFDETDVLLCPLPLFHVFAAYPILMSAIASGAHVVLPTPAGYRGDGVFDNFWKLIERWRVSFLVGVPTAISALMQRPVDADVSSLKNALCGSAPLPVELFNRFEAATGVRIVEGYGMTETTCLISVNPVDGVKKVGSVGLPMPYTDVRILECEADGSIRRTCGPDEVGEICVANPGVLKGATYTEAHRNHGLYAGGTHLRTGDLGRIDADGYLWITGRAKDLIIRGGHNIDPALIEEALAAHPAVGFAAAIGQPDAHSGELPSAYVELAAGRSATPAELLAWAETHVRERAAIPKYIEIVPALPKTAVGKVLKNELRKLAIARVYGAALAEAGLGAEVAEVFEDTRRGLVARLRRTDAATDDAAVQRCLGRFTRGWEWAAPDT